MAAPDLLRKRENPAQFACSACSDTGLLDAGPIVARFAWQVPFTTMPCLCAKGKQIAPTHEFCRNDAEWKAKWEASLEIPA